MNGHNVEVLHVGKGVSIATSKHDELQSALSKAWPRNYGRNAPGSKTPEGRAHTAAFEAVIGAFWPEETHLSFSRSRMKKIHYRPKFHDERLLVAESRFFRA